MTYSIVYSSRTGNTKLLAETLRAALPAGDCLYFGGPSEDALRADRIYVGFWTDKGSCDEDTARFLSAVTGREIWLFGTAGFGGDQEYFDKVLARTAKNLPKGLRPVGAFMCQGKMPMTVRQRYEKMKAAPVHMPNVDSLIENFDRALSHPDQQDLENLTRAVQGR